MLALQDDLAATAGSKDLLVSLCAKSGKLSAKWREVFWG
jgi:hypothetical protein